MDALMLRGKLVWLKICHIS